MNCSRQSVRVVQVEPHTGRGVFLIAHVVYLQKFPVEIAIAVQEIALDRYNFFITKVAFKSILVL